MSWGDRAVALVQVNLTLLSPGLSSSCLYLGGCRDLVVQIPELRAKSRQAKSGGWGGGGRFPTLDGSHPLLG